MGNLFASLLTTAGTMRAYERSLATIQNNVANVNTPGFVKQRQILEAKRFDLPAGIPGGVEAGRVADYRNPYLEEGVRRRGEQFGRWDQSTRDLASLESVFSVQPGAGVPGAFDRLFQSFSQLTVAPNDRTARQLTLDRAREAATSLNTTARSLTEARGTANAEIQATVARINQIGERIADFNRQARESTSNSKDPGLQASINSTLEELSGLVNFRSVEQPDGSVSLFIGAGRQFVLGSTTLPLQVSSFGEERRIVDGGEEDITALVDGGKLASLLENHNERIPGFLGELNALSKNLADAVNDRLSQGIDQSGLPPAEALFSYDETAGAASTLRVADLDPEDLALATPGSPGGNGNAVELAKLGQQVQPNGFTLAQGYASIASRFGRDLNFSRENKGIAEQLLQQARTLRQDETGVQLDEEAAQLIQNQRAYQAAAQLFKVLNELTQSLLNLPS